ncbi:hypothetical protein QAD02_021852 [Eretmocerus hayati]|uniref:Uncharacterized protein n=1 Tax=Eretmocerus hayati TaxID=131215 RepID=A0ACC2PTW0_9HYME|nr:hypothetical protein QAD02_021852 [Eretmocerus hayati]
MNKRMTNMEFKDRGRKEAQKKIVGRLEHLEGVWNAEGPIKGPTMRNEAQEGAEWTTMERKLEECEKRAKRNNLITIGKKLEQTRLEEKVEQWLEKDIQVTCKIIKAWKIRNKKEEMVGIEYENSDKWKEIMMNKITWLEEKEEAWIGNELGEYDLVTIEAKNRKGRASGGIIMATKKYLKAKTTRTNRETLESKVIINKEKWKIIGTYMNKGREENWKHRGTDRRKRRT